MTYEPSGEWNVGDFTFLLLTDFLSKKKCLLIGVDKSTNKPAFYDGRDDFKVLAISIVFWIREQYFSHFTIIAETQHNFGIQKLAHMEGFSWLQIFTPN